MYIHIYIYIYIYMLRRRTSRSSGLAAPYLPDCPGGNDI